MAALLAVWCHAASAAPPPDADPDLAAWFHDQHSVSRAWCCDISDGHILDDSDWRTGPHGYQIRINGIWSDVPPDALRDPAGGPNPTGAAVAWWSVSDGGVRIYCFAPGWEG